MRIKRRLVSYLKSGVLWLMVEFFGVFDISYILPARFTIIATIGAIAGYQSFWSFRHHAKALTTPGVVFAIFVSIFILFDMLHAFMPTPLTGGLYALSRIAGVLAYYFFIMSYSAQP